MGLSLVESLHFSRFIVKLFDSHHISIIEYVCYLFKKKVKVKILFVFIDFTGGYTEKLPGRLWLDVSDQPYIYLLRSNPPNQKKNLQIDVDWISTYVNLLVMWFLNICKTQGTCKTLGIKTPCCDNILLNIHMSRGLGSINKFAMAFLK